MNKKKMVYGIVTIVLFILATSSIIGALYVYDLFPYSAYDYTTDK